MLNITFELCHGPLGNLWGIGGGLAWRKKGPSLVAGIAQEVMSSYSNILVIYLGKNSGVKSAVVKTASATRVSPGCCRCDDITSGVMPAMKPRPLSFCGQVPPLEQLIGGWGARPGGRGSLPSPKCVCLAIVNDAHGSLYIGFVDLLLCILT